MTRLLSYPYTKREVITIAQNDGKKFEQDFSSSFGKDFWVYRLRDNAASFGNGTNTRFASSNICDFIIYHDITQTLYLAECKSTKGTSIPYTMLKENQIKGLTEASEHRVVPCFIFNYRNKNNDTYFMMIDDFNIMYSELPKKSFNPEDLEKYGALKIESSKKRTRYKYNTEKFVQETHL